MSEDHNPPRVPLSRLDPTRDNLRFDAIVHSIAAEAIAARDVERAPTSILAGVATWNRPALLAAGIVLVVALATLTFKPDHAPAAPLSLVESAGVPAPLAEWAMAGRGANVAGLVGPFDAAAAAVANADR